MSDKRLEQVIRENRSKRSKRMRERKKQKQNKQAQVARDKSIAQITLMEKMKQRARQIISSRAVDECTAICFRLFQQLEERKNLIKELTLERVRNRLANEQIRVLTSDECKRDALYESCTLLSCVSKDVHNKLLAFVEKISDGKFTNKDGPLDSGFQSERWYDFNKTESKVCLHVSRCVRP